MPLEAHPKSSARAVWGTQGQAGPARSLLTLAEGPPSAETKQQHRAPTGSLGMGGTLSNQIGQMPTGPVPWLWHMGDRHGDSHPPLRGQQGPGGAQVLGRTREGNRLGSHHGHLPLEGLPTPAPPGAPRPRDGHSHVSPSASLHCADCATITITNASAQHWSCS